MMTEWVFNFPDRNSPYPLRFELQLGRWDYGIGAHLSLHRFDVHVCFIFGAMSWYWSRETYDEKMKWLREAAGKKG